MPMWSVFLLFTKGLFYNITVMLVCLTIKKLCKKTQQIDEKTMQTTDYIKSEGVLYYDSAQTFGYLAG